MPHIFLDIDGILNNISDMRDDNSPANPFARDHKNWNQQSIDALNKVIVATDAKIVISSTWRILFPDIKWWNDQFKLASLSAECVGVTGSSPNGFRGREVAEYLKTHPEIDSYIIIDDESDFYPDQPRIRIDAEYGLREKHIPLIIDILINKNFEPISCMKEFNPPV